MDLKFILRFFNDIGDRSRRCRWSRWSRPRRSRCFSFCFFVAPASLIFSSCSCPSNSFSNNLSRSWIFGAIIHSALSPRSFLAQAVSLHLPNWLGYCMHLVWSLFTFLKFDASLVSKPFGPKSHHEELDFLLPTHVTPPCPPWHWWKVSKPFLLKAYFS